MVLQHALGVLPDALLHRVGWFWPMWCLLTAASALCTAWIFRTSPGPVFREQEGSRSGEFDWSPSTMISLAALTLFLGAYAAMILIGEDFAMYDNAQFTAFSLRGVNLPPPYSRDSGRFFPLGLQEFNVINHFTKTITGYHAFAILELVLLAIVVLKLDGQLNISFRVALIIAAFITPGVVLSFTGLIYPERNLLLLLVCLVLFVKLFEQTHSALWAVAAVLSAQVMLYIKEPVCLLLFSFAAARLALRIRNYSNTSWSIEQLWHDENRLDLCIAALSAAFVVFYALMMLPTASVKYVGDRNVSVVEAVRYYVSVDLLAWTLAVVATIRMYRIFRGGTAPLLLWDGLAWGGVAYFTAYLALRMVHAYYLAPVDLIAVLYLGRLLSSSWSKSHFGARVLMATLATLVACQSLTQSAFYVLERKLVIRQKAAIAGLILEKYWSQRGAALNLHFPLTSPYLLSEFAAYLSYRGLPVEQAGTEASAGTPVRIFGSRIVRDGRCVAWHKFVCHAGTVESPSLVVVLPEDAVPEQWTAYKEYEEKLHSIDPRIGRPSNWLSTAFGYLAAHRPK